jgi:hypothetical protein
MMRLRNTAVPEYRIVRHSINPVPDRKKLTIPEAVRYRNKETQSGIFLVRYRTEMTDAGMPMPVLVFWMPMPTYAVESGGRVAVSENSDFTAMDALHC